MPDACDMTLSSFSGPDLLCVPDAMWRSPCATVVEEMARFKRYGTRNSAEIEMAKSTDGCVMGTPGRDGGLGGCRFSGGARCFWVCVVAAKGSTEARRRGGTEKRSGDRC